MKPRYYKYWWNKNKFEWYRITHDNKVQIYMEKKKKWRDVISGKFSKLHDEKLEEISEEDYFLEAL